VREGQREHRIVAGVISNTAIPLDSVPVPPTRAHGELPAELLHELVSHLRQNRTQLREEWAGRITEARLLTAMTKEEIFAEATSVYDAYVEALATGTFEALQAYSRNLSERIIPRGVETHEVVGMVTCQLKRDFT